MEYEQIKQLIQDMGNSKLSSLDIEFPDGTKVKMEKDGENTVLMSPNAQLDTQTKDVVQVSEQNNTNTEEGMIVTSPMVGTFYAKSSPNSNAYVEVGTTVKKGDILCIIEAMKLMNEIESEFDGTVSEVYVKDGDSVEYGEPLFKIV